jgi:hypothetical protein
MADGYAKICHGGGGGFGFVLAEKYFAAVYHAGAAVDN